MSASLTPMMPEAVSANSQRKDRTRTRILDAALALFAERGFHGTAVPLIAQRAQVGAGTIYRHFDSKETLVNAVFRRAKTALLDYIQDGLDEGASARAQFDHLWARLVAYAEEQSLAFRFLEMQDHVPYLDDESRRVELSVLAPIFLTAVRFQEDGTGSDVPAEVLMALVWGAFVGVMKYERLGYLALDAGRLNAARDACWKAIQR